VELTLDTSLEAVDAGEDAVLKEAQEIGFDEDERHRIGISVRECLVNAVVHGNAYNARKKVHLGIHRGDASLEVVIGDEGEFFDMTALPDPTADDNLLRSSGRGLLLMKAFMDEVQVQPRTPHGTEVRLLKRLGAPA
jgi:serine/threonine-protein kinase RsbW